MPILVNCEECGKGYRFRDDQAGQSMLCKNCGWDIDIPRRQRAAPTQRRRRPQRSARRPSQAVATPSSEHDDFLDKPSSISTTKILIGVGVGAGVLLMLLIVVVVFILSGGDDARTVAEQGRPNLDRGTNSTRPGENSRNTSANAVKPIFWNVQPDPLPAPIVFSGSEISIPIEGASSGLLYSATPSEFIAVGQVTSGKQIWDLRTMELVGTVKVPNAHKDNCALSPDGKYLLVEEISEGKPQTCLWSTKDGTKVRDLTATAIAGSQLVYIFASP